MAWSRPGQIAPDHWDIHLITPPSQRLLYVLNGPALLITFYIADLIGLKDNRLAWWLGIVPATALWYAIGLWFDRFHESRVLYSWSSWREPSRLIGAFFLLMAVLFVALIWPRVFAEAQGLPYVGFEGIAGLLIWPVIVGIIGARTLVRGRY